MSSPPPTETGTLLRQNQELRQRLQDEACNYRRRIDTYKQAQTNQAALVGRLQSKVLQYKQRCNDLEGRMHETIKPIPSTSYNSPPKSNTAKGPVSVSSINTPECIIKFFVFSVHCRHLQIYNAHHQWNRRHHVIMLYITA